MAITLELPPEEEQRLQRQAEMAGQDVTDYLREILRRESAASSAVFAGKDWKKWEDWENLLDEFGETAPAGIPPLSDYAVSREGIYEDHD